MLNNVRGAIAGQHNLVQTLRALPFKSLEDWQKVQTNENELQRHYSGLQNCPNVCTFLKELIIVSQ